MRLAEPVRLAAAWERAVRCGDFVDAWRINDLVLSRGERVPDDPSLPYHLRFVWDGRPFDARHVLVRCYHGLGDTLQFIRYLPPLRRRAASVTLEAQPELIPLLHGMPSVDRLVPFRVEGPLSPSECDIEVMELAHALRLHPGIVRPPYLFIPPSLVAETRQRLGPGFRIGICCRSGDWDPGRSIPPAALSAALPSSACKVKLQPGACPDIAWANPLDALDDIMQTAALICAADLIITADTMIAHFAGALGQPAILLLKHRADWRWMDGRSDSPWYPSMRLYRQMQPGRWTEPLAGVAQDVLERLHRSTPDRPPPPA